MPKSDAMDWYQVPELYEVFLGASGEDEAFYGALAAEEGGPVLDLGCGQGRLSLALAAAGHAVTGVDASEAMLERARAAAAARSLRVSWLRARWEDLQPPRRFGLAVLPYNGLQHLLDDAALIALSRALQSVLLPGGRWALDLHVPQAAILDRDPQRWWDVESALSGPAGERVLAERSAYDLQTQVLTQTWRLGLVDGTHVERSLALRQYPVEALQAQFQRLGWKVLGLYENFDRRPLGAQALRQIWVLSV